MADTVRRFRKKPVVIEAMQWSGTSLGAADIIDWVLAGGGTARYTCTDPERCARHDGDCPHHITIETLEGAMNVGIGDWIIRGVKGEFYPCRGDIFRQTYEAVEANRAGRCPRCGWVDHPHHTDAELDAFDCDHPWHEEADRG